MGSKELGFLLTVVMLFLAFDCGNCNTQEIEKVVSLRSNAVTRVEDFESVLHRDYRSVHRSQRSVTNASETKDALDSHNRLRRLAGASDEEIMTWNNDLANMAAGWAENCNFYHGQPSPAPPTLQYTSLGQNLYTISGISSFDITNAIQQWYEEKKYFNYDTLACDQNAPYGCGHYTQVVWATSRELGCGYKLCDSLRNTTGEILKNAYFLVCNYGPPGNVQGQKPFQIGTACSRCASGSWWCTEGLCDRSCTTTGQSSTCGCAPVCLNFASVDTAKCSCTCTPGWYGSDCSVVCEDKDSLCNPKPGQYGYPPEYCTRSDYGPTIREKCPKMCNQCQAAGNNNNNNNNNNNHSTSMKPSLLGMLSVWLSWLLLYSFRSV